MSATRALGGAGMLLVLTLVGSAGAEEWYDAYQDGLKALARGEGPKAAALFERAIRKRPEPGVNVPTYGTNVEERYFPYLRLGEALLLASQPEAASRALARSDALAKEPADERARLAARVAAALERLRPSPSAQPTTLAPASVPPTATPLAEPEPSATPALPAPRPASPSVAATPSARPSAPPDRAAGSHSGRPDSFDRVPPPPRTDPASLEVYSQPAGALVYLDDEFLGGTDPVSGRLVKGDLAPGHHRLRFSLAGHEDLMQELDVRAGVSTSFRGALSPVADERSKQPWPLLPLGAALVAVLLLAIWAVQRRGSTSGPEAILAAPTPARPLRPTPVTPLRSDATPPGLERTPDLVDDQPVPFGEYTLLRRLGRGGMAAVYKAERRGEIYALKRPLADHLEDPQFLERFLREAEIGRTLYHPNIVRIFERGEVGNVPFFTMELIEGETLHAKLRREGAVEPRAAAKLLAQVAEALDYAHHKGVVHRDLKPSNIMIVPDGTAKVMDYGIARARRFEGLTTTGAFLGTPDYVAPETVEGGRNDARSDLYSLGIVFYETLAGALPFTGDTPFAVLRKHCTEEPTPVGAEHPGVPPELDAMVLRLLRKNPAERYGTAEELLVDLQAFLGRH